MRRLVPAALAALSLATLAACADSGTIAGPAARPSPSASLEVARAAAATRQILMLDKCDPRSFNAAIGASTCERPGAHDGVPFQTFIAQIQAFKAAPDWRFEPRAAEIQLGTTLLAINRGGEVHTFTEVEEFGGGIVPILNDLSGNPNVAPECLALQDDDFVPPGGTYPDKPDKAGVENYQCCIHPWMRTTITIRGR